MDNTNGKLIALLLGAGLTVSSSQAIAFTDEINEEEVISLRSFNIFDGHDDLFKDDVNGGCGNAGCGNGSCSLK